MSHMLKRESGSASAAGRAQFPWRDDPKVVDVKEATATKDKDFGIGVTPPAPVTPFISRRALARGERSAGRTNCRVFLCLAPRLDSQRHENQSSSSEHLARLQKDKLLTNLFLRPWVEGKPTGHHPFLLFVFPFFFSGGEGLRSGGGRGRHSP